MGYILRVLWNKSCISGILPYDIYSLTELGSTYWLFTWKDHFVYKIDESSLDLHLSNNSIAENTFYVGELSISGENWINPDKYWHDSNFGVPIYSLSGADAEYFEIQDGHLMFKSAPNFDFKVTYSVTVNVISLSGKSVSKNFNIEVKDWDQ